MTVTTRLVIVLIVILFISGCTVRTAYNYLDWYLAWQVDDYVELTDEQEQQFDRVVDEFIVWHRQQELPRYRDMLADLKGAIEQQNPEKLKLTLTAARTLWLDSAQQIAPNAILLLNKLTPKQRQELVNNIRGKQQEAHDKWRKRELRSVEKKREESIEQLVDTLGDITEQQKQDLLANFDSYTSTTEMRIASRKLWLEKFEQALLAQQNIDQLTLFSLFTDISSYRSEKYLAASAENMQNNLEFLTRQLPTLTAAQQEHVLDNIQDYLEDLDYLIKQNS